MNQLIVNGKEMILSDQTRIGITYQANNIGELQNRQGTFTNTFKLPIVRENIEALELVNQMTSTTLLPYKKLSATYIENGIEIIGNGYATIVSVDSNFINMNIVSGNVDLLEAIGDITVGDLYLNDQIFPWNIDVAVLLRSGTAYLVYPLVNFKENEENVLNGNTTADIRDMLPCCNVQLMFDKLSDYIGFYFTGKYLDSNEHKKMILTPSDLTIKEENLLLLQTSSTITSSWWKVITIPAGQPAYRTPIPWTEIYPNYTNSTGDFSGNSFNASDEINGSLKLGGYLTLELVNILGVNNFPNYADNLVLIYQIFDDLGTVVAEYTEMPITITDSFYTNTYIPDITTGDILMTLGRTYYSKIIVKADYATSSTFITIKTNNLKFSFVPSGKITADRLCVSIYSDKPLIVGIACFGSFLSINTEPP